MPSLTEALALFAAKQRVREKIMSGETKVVWLEQGDILLLVSPSSKQIHEVSENDQGELETSTYSEVGGEQKQDRQPKPDQQPDQDQDEDDQEEDDQDEDSTPQPPA